MSGGIPWLTDPQRDFLAYLTVLTIQPQLKPPRSHERIADALGELAERGEVLLRADDNNLWVIIHGQVIVHAARDWLEWASQRWTAAESKQQLHGRATRQPLQRAAPMRSSKYREQGIDTAPDRAANRRARLRSGGRPQGQPSRRNICLRPREEAKS